jgi:hypothetical protein
MRKRAERKEYKEKDREDVGRMVDTWISGGKIQYILIFPWGKSQYILIFPGGKLSIYSFFRGEK